MIRLYLIRHGQTPGNKLQRYIGTTDEPLSTEGKEFLEKLTYPMPEALYVSPLCRCVETAGILFPGKSFHIIEELSECDFGEFENKNYKELSGNQDYQRWIDSNGTLPFPGGESREAFKHRSLTGFQKAVTPVSYTHLYGVLALFSESARTERNIMALMMLVLAVFTVVSYGNVFTQGKYLCGMIVAVLVTSILLNVSYQYSYEKDYLSEFEEKDQALEKLQDVYKRQHPGTWQIGWNAETIINQQLS